MSERNDVIRILGNRLSSLEHMADEALRLDLMGSIHVELATAISFTRSAIEALESAAASAPKKTPKKSAAAPAATGEKKKRGRPKKSATTIGAFATTIAPPPLPSPFDTQIATNGAPASS